MTREKKSWGPPRVGVIRNERKNTLREKRGPSWAELGLRSSSPQPLEGITPQMETEYTGLSTKAAPVGVENVDQVERPRPAKGRSGAMEVPEETGSNHLMQASIGLGHNETATIEPETDCPRPPTRSITCWKWDWAGAGPRRAARPV